MGRSPQRSCVGCRAVRGKKELVRIVHTADGQFTLDPTGKGAGRGAYLCPDVACLGNAVKRKSFDRAFRQAVPRDALAALEAGIREYLRAQAGGESEGNHEG
ncbi:MAG: RNase P modulator RnpM [Actinomycetota bacterium]